MATQDLINRRDLIGKGLKFPFEVQTRTGGTAPQASSSISDGFDRINQSIQQILGTSIGERMPRRNFGCLAGETEIKLANCTLARIDSRVGKETFAYGCDGNDIIQIETPGAIYSGDKTTILVIINSTGIRCTPDHLFQLIDGSYKEAIKLTCEDSLMGMQIFDEGIRISGLVLDCKTVPTFDLVNSPTQNFAIEPGIFVHNSLANELVFMPNDEILQGMAERYIEDAIEKWEKRIIVNDVVTEIDRNRGILFIHITYKVISTQRDGNYVYPLYLDKLRAQK